MDYLAYNNKYLPPLEVERVFESFAQLAGQQQWQSSVIGRSVQGLPIKMYQVGEGKLQILIFSQIHGDEPTATRGLLAFLHNLLTTGGHLLTKVRLNVIAQVNVDGATAYLRQNAAGVDLNRDFKDLTQVETRALVAAIDQVQPDYCLALHDQRTCHAAGLGGRASNLAFLVPSADLAGSTTDLRQHLMRLVVAMSLDLKKQGDCQLSRFDDRYMAGGAGEYCLGVNRPYILIEAGFAPRDYLRRYPASLVSAALMSVCNILTGSSFQSLNFKDYFGIPVNSPEFVDLLIKNIQCGFKEAVPGITDTPLVFKEKLVDGLVEFYPSVPYEDLEHPVRGHCEIDLTSFNIE